MSESPFEKLTLIKANFIESPKKDKYYIETIVKLNKIEGLSLEFPYIHFAMSKNGGLIAICKKNLYHSKGKVLKENLIVMHQDASNPYLIKIDDWWVDNKKYIVSLDINDKEQIYAFCNDGTTFKVDIIRNELVEQIMGSRIKGIDGEGIVKAKLFENGCIILTKEGTIYLVDNFKNVEPQFIVSLKEQLGIEISDKIDFLGIPQKKTCSGLFEILIMCPNIEGVLHIIKQDPTTNNQQKFKYETKQSLSNKNKKVKVSILNSPNLEEFKPIIKETSNEVNKTSTFSEDKNNNQMLSNLIKHNSQLINYNTEKNVNNKERIGEVTAIAISPSQRYFALYVKSKKEVYLFSTEISENKKNEMKILNYSINEKKLDENMSDKEKEEFIKEEKNALSYEDRNEFDGDQVFQFLFCGENSVGICGGKILMLINKLNETIPILLPGFENSKKKLSTVCKCISEVDGIRYMTGEDIHLLMPVSKEFDDICDPFSRSDNRKLIESYEKYLIKDPFCHDILKEIKPKELGKAIKNLLTVAGDLYWIESDSDSYENRNLQNFLIKAAHFGKSIIDSNEFNFQEFKEKCKYIRVMNNMRTLSSNKRYVTYREFLSMEPDYPDSLIKKTMRHLNFKLAFEICNYLGGDTKNIFLRYAVAKIKNPDFKNGMGESKNLFDALNNMFEKVEDISYIEIAKKCIKHKKEHLAKLFLEKEKSILVKIPQYLQLQEWEKAIKYSIDSCDLNVIKVVIDKIYKVEGPERFNEIFLKQDKARKAVIEYFKNIGEKKILKEYLKSQKDYEELFFLTLNEFFDSKKKDEREKLLKEADTFLEQKAFPKEDRNFYKEYISDLKKSLDFKKECIEKGIISKNDINCFDISIYDCYEKCNKSEDYDMIEKQYSKNFKISKRIITIMKFRKLIKEKKYQEIDEIVKKVGKNLEKDLGVNRLKIAKLLYEFKLLDKAEEYANLEEKDEDKNNFLNILKAEKNPK